MSHVRLRSGLFGTGTFTVESPNSNTDRTMVLPDVDGDIYVSPGDGIQVATPSGAAARTITAGTGISVSDGDGIAGNPTISNSGVTSINGLTGAVDNGVPSGAVSHFAMSTPPTGWLKANGAVVSRTTYAALFAAIGTTFGIGDGATTFGLPDLRGEFVRGWDDGRGVDSGRAFGTSQAGQNEAHSHTYTDPGHSHTYTRYSALLNQTGSATPCWNGTASIATSTATTGITINNNGGTEARPRNVALLACIKF